MITVMGASGHTGGKIAEILLNAGEKVRVLGRSESKLAAHQRAGATVLTGDAGDPAFLTQAFRDADAVYTLIAPDPHTSDYRAAQDRQGEAIEAAIKESGVSHVVVLSSLGADSDIAAGPIAGLGAQEKRLEQLKNTNVLLLRPASFFENFEGALGLIKELGLYGDSVAADLAIPMVATRDIAAVAANALQSRQWSGVVARELLGPRDLSYREATRLLGEKIGQPGLHYVQLPDGDMIKSLTGAGLSENFSSLYVEMTRAINAQRLSPRNGRTSENSTPTPFEYFAEDLAQAYRKM